MVAGEEEAKVREKGGRNKGERGEGEGEFSEVSRRKRRWKNMVQEKI